MLITSLNRIVHGKISIEFERDSSMRRTEIVIVTHDSEGNEVQGKLTYANDDGTLTGGFRLIDGIDITTPS